MEKVIQISESFVNIDDDRQMLIQTVVTNEGRAFSREGSGEWKEIDLPNLSRN